MALTHRELRVAKKFRYYKEINERLAKEFHHQPCMRAIYNALANMWSLAIDEIKMPVYEKEEKDAEAKQ